MLSLKIRPVILALPALAVVGLVSCVPGPPTNPQISGLHQPTWMEPANAQFHGAIVKEAGYDYTKAKFSGMACNSCHAGDSPDQASPVKGAPNCYSCHVGGPDGSDAHPAGWGDPTNPAYHGALVRAAGYDYTKAKTNNLTCNACHAGESPAQPGANSRAPNCFACHPGGPDGSAGHPLFWVSPPSPIYHGAAVIAAGYDYTRAVVGSLTCNACHGGASPIEPSLNSRAGNCFACHLGGPDGSAGHSPGYAVIPGDSLGEVPFVPVCPTCEPTPAPTASLALDPLAYTGIAIPVGVTVTDRSAIQSPGIIESVAVVATSVADPAGKTFLLYETLPGSGIFKGAIPLERVFNESGTAVINAAGKLAVYAEGGVATDLITVSYRTASRSAQYSEPPSTVTGIITVAGNPAGGSGVQLSGAGGFLRSTVSRSDGSYAFHGVPSGPYSIVASKNGAQQLTSTVVVP